MKKLLARLARQSPAMIVAMLALFVALTGTAVATTSALVTGKQIKNGSITGLDVKNKSLTAKDIKGQLRGPRGLPGAQGVQGPQGAKGDKGDKGDTGPTDLSKFGRMASSTTLLNGSTAAPNVFTPALEVTLTVPAGGKQAVVVYGEVVGFETFGAACPVNTLISRVAPAADSGIGYFYRPTTYYQELYQRTHVFVEDPGTYTYQLLIADFCGGTDRLDLVDGAMWATMVPFNGAGASPAAVAASSAQASVLGTP